MGKIVFVKSNKSYAVITNEQLMYGYSLYKNLPEDFSSTYNLEINNSNFDFPLYLDIRKKISLNSEDIEIYSDISRNELEKIMRLEILCNVENYHNLFHLDKKIDINSAPIVYGGRVYNEQEMRNLVDSSLDFWLTAGRYHKQFEIEFAEYLGVKYALLTNSGSSANLLAFSALTSPKLKEKRIMPGDEVITVAAGFPTTVGPIVQNKAVPVFIDVELGTYNIIAERIEEAITPKTKAIMIAHTMGNPFELDKVLEVANKYDLWVIEDNCDALGSTYKGKLTGTHGHIGTSSFYPPHHMTMGEGGAVYTNNALLKTIIESFRDWGRDCWCPSGCDNTCGKRFGWELGSLPYGYDHKYTYSHIGYNLRVTDMQAAVGVAQLKKVPEFVRARKNNFNRLYQGLRDLEEYFILPRATVNSDPSWFGFILTVRDGAGFTKNEIVKYLEEKRIQTRMLFSGNLIRQPAYQGVNYRVHGDLTNTDKILHDTFLVGVYPGLTDAMIDYVIGKIREFVLSKNAN
ncbi:lipopolysaccharide biosynthesis protein RfbH [Paenibacillus macerans]|uniref:lipopolysaccharide biosynthesis protein RfbH n=1 Tax=Paenibacillus macerans TaxID=44252 RepID=UPI00203DAEDC|nr:lipopolysaccharide biosynthesis protein RfbH [Paenibacillus macerans]MCM3701076.1 lipopolysaccharide biosynthesis protein RfbH [Paenibacillus macerans]